MIIIMMKIVVIMIYINHDNAYYDCNKVRSNKYNDMFISIDNLKHVPLNRSHITSWNPSLFDRQSGGFEGSPRFNLR
jgi:hypothetical protein